VPRGVAGAGGLIVLALLALPLAGCAQPPTDTPTHAFLAVPSWKVGWSWNYTLEDGANATVGWVRYTVEAIEPVGNVTDRAYRVKVERYDVGDVDHDGVPNQTFVRTVHYDAATLNLVWSACGKPGYFGACEGRDPELDFPLVDGKGWDSMSGGDVVIRFVNHATKLPGGPLWRVTRSAPDVGWQPRVDLFDASVGFYRERRMLGGSSTQPGVEPEVWTLQARPVL